MIVQGHIHGIYPISPEPMVCGSTAATGRGQDRYTDLHSSPFGPSSPLRSDRSRNHDPKTRWRYAIRAMMAPITTTSLPRGRSDKQTASGKIRDTGARSAQDHTRRVATAEQDWQLQPHTLTLKTPACWPKELTLSGQRKIMPILRPQPNRPMRGFPRVSTRGPWRVHAQGRLPISRRPHRHSADLPAPAWHGTHP